MTKAEEGEYNRWKGGAGEAYAIGYFLPEFFVMFQQPEISNFYDGFGWPRVGDSKQAFGFEVKTGSKGFSQIPATRVDRWLEDLSVMPVILIRVEEDSEGRPHLSFAILHDWLRQHPNLAVKLGNRTISFHPRYFRLADSPQGKQRLREAVESEMQRVAGLGRWATRRSLALGVTEADMFRGVGRLSRLETPQAVLDEVLLSPTVLGDISAFSALRARLRDTSAPYHGPASQAWRREIDSPIPLSLVEAEAAQLGRFLRALASDDLNFPMPSHNWFQVATWRVFFLEYSASIVLLERFFARPEGRSPSEVRAAMSLLAILADENSGDEVIRRKACSLLIELNDTFDAKTVDTLEEYLVIRQYLFSRVEGLGQESDITNCRNFLSAHRRMDVDPEVALHLQYYGRSTPQEAATFVIKQLASPKARQKKSAPILADIVERMSDP